ncbi:MAG: hypothetical protein RML47_04915 [Bacteroidota bacterium]|nr:hypothetical protein [Rhodothermia bacterium]MDW8285430.1 hypothetical protein [Bacteroidota bacterium]
MSYRIRIILEPNGSDPLDLRQVLHPLPSPAGFARWMAALSLALLIGLGILSRDLEQARAYWAPPVRFPPVPQQAATEPGSIAVKLVLPRYGAPQTRLFSARIGRDGSGGSPNPVDRLGLIRRLYDAPRPDMDPDLMVKPLVARNRYEPRAQEAVSPLEDLPVLGPASSAFMADALTPNRLLRHLWGWGSGRGAGIGAMTGDGSGRSPEVAAPVLPVESLFVPLLQAYRPVLDRLYARHRAADPMLRGRVMASLYVAETGSLRVLELRGVALRASQPRVRLQFLRELEVTLEQLSVSEPRLLNRRLTIPLEFE